jgi:hypothetical protein
MPKEVILKAEECGNSNLVTHRMNEEFGSKVVICQSLFVHPLPEVK